MIKKVGKACFRLHDHKGSFLVIRLEITFRIKNGGSHVEFDVQKSTGEFKIVHNLSAQFVKEQNYACDYKIVPST